MIRLCPKVKIELNNNGNKVCPDMWDIKFHDYRIRCKMMINRKFWGYCTHFSDNMKWQLINNHLRLRIFHIANIYIS
jgi:hypothetical protein